ncbi:4-aminobutyrate transaminase [Aphanomyces invadans]|uniref:4-aminobutyrate transaminase n=1 Tax=Aphanomyces invadans TaxID=157072 RepID=A0A024UHV5_9STRA|nr:4-aminobutyrate transaminase [Aphanomyces invadans]ETW06006.1 4-aminobutyrate transaminase [Aphanomyces invadans]|eukprot:XP_008865783.1 4-aminobutyrate transaminase [Aphanomyces invadans]
MLPSASSIAHGVGRLTDMVLAKGAGSFVWNVEGQKLLDFTSGIAVTSLGHCHPRIVEAVQKQAGQLVHGQASVAYHEPMFKYSAALLPLLPQGLDSLSFFTTGAEAAENAVKLARHATEKPNVIVFQGGFHGRTIGAMSFTTSKTIYKAGFGPLASGVFVAPYPYSLHSPFSNPCAQTIAWCLEQVELVLKQQTAPSETAAILIETVLGEGGYVPPPPGFLEGLNSLCHDHDILLIADEVQCGFGRTGELFAIDGHYNTTPDILVMAKGIANGYPLSAIASRKDLTDLQPKGSMGGTYAGNAVSCAAALATLDVFETENTLVNASVRGAQLMAALTKLQDVYPILDVRGLGLMVAVELDTSVPPGTAARVAHACVGHGMLLLPTSVYETLRFIPPLNVSAGEIELGVAIFAKALADALS